MRPTLQKPALILCAIVLGAVPASAGETVYVKVFVDEEEPAVERVWQARLRLRLEHASEIIDEFADIQFAISGFGTWQSDNRINDLSRSLGEFEQEVDRRGKELAIGFTSQYRFTPGRHNLGGTRGPLHPFILIRESNPRIVEVERLEVLVHEIGHFLGATHCSKASSVMRPVLGDGRARLRSFRISFDPQNARIIRTVAREVSYLELRRFSQLSPESKEKLTETYELLGLQLPKDPATPRMLQFLTD